MKYNFIILLVAFFISLLASYFQYFYKVNHFKYRLLLFVLKTISFFLIIVLLVNPKIKSIETQNTKPTLAVLIDNSSSIQFFIETKNVNSFVSEISNNAQLKSKFNIKKYQFSKELALADTLNFDENNTNIYAALSAVNNLNKNKIAPIVLLSDGNQTFGRDYEYFKSKQTVYPVLVGDTTKYLDVSINQLNVNKYSFLNNKFPVEVLVNYNGDKDVSTQLVIQKKGRVIYRQNLKFTKENTTKTIQTNLEAKNEGLQFYEAFLTQLQNEKNIKNNRKTFSVEVINEQTKTLILSSIIHPDLGTFKKGISSNKQNSVAVFTIDNFKENILDYEMVILYQPNNKFTSILEKIEENKLNYLVITGTATDWNFLNSKNLGFSKKAINQGEEYMANFNENYLTFLQEDIGFNNLPTLKDKFGSISLDYDNEILLYQNINGIVTKEPLLATFTKENQKVGVLFGENIWQWRTSSFLNSNSFSDFDKFLGNLIQYLASTKKRNRLEINVAPIYNANSIININAFYTDENYKFDSRANLEISITNVDTKETKRFPFSLKNSSYQVSVENLAPGNYSYLVTVFNQNISRKGEFKITDFNIEEQFNNANLKKMSQLALNSGGKLFFKTQTDLLIDELLNNEKYPILQKQIEQEKELIHWKWLLAFIIFLLGLEWFIRKYLGKI